jgi:hypothetical protein
MLSVSFVDPDPTRTLAPQGFRAKLARRDVLFFGPLTLVGANRAHFDSERFRSAPRTCWPPRSKLQIGTARTGSSRRPERGAHIRHDASGVHHAARRRGGEWRCSSAGPPSTCPPRPVHRKSACAGPGLDQWRASQQKAAPYVRDGSWSCQNAGRQAIDTLGARQLRLFGLETGPD